MNPDPTPARDAGAPSARTADPSDPSTQRRPDAGALTDSGADPAARPPVEDLAQQSMAGEEDPGAALDTSAVADEARAVARADEQKRGKG